MILLALHRTFYSIGKWFSGPPADALAVAAAERAKAKAAYDARVSKGDDRGAGEAWPGLRAATLAELRASVGIRHGR